MPYLDVKLYDFRVTDESAAALCRALTDALCSVVGEEARESTWVVISPVPPEHWGIGGTTGRSR